LLFDGTANEGTATEQLLQLGDLLADGQQQWG
jgi:hypothetical protein